MIISVSTTCAGSNSGGSPEQHRQQRQPGDRHVDGGDGGMSWRHRVVEGAGGRCAPRPRCARSPRRAAPGPPPARHVDCRARPSRCRYCAAFSNKRIVHAIARHRHRLTVGLEGLHEPQHCWGIVRANTRTSRNARRRPASSSASTCSPGERARHRGDAGLARDGKRRGRVVAGDHHHRHACGMRLRDRGRHVGAQRGSSSRQPEQFEVVVNVAAALAGRLQCGPAPR